MKRGDAGAGAVEAEFRRRILKHSMPSSRSYLHLREGAVPIDRQQRLSVHDT